MNSLYQKEVSYDYTENDIGSSTRYVRLFNSWKDGSSNTKKTIRVFNKTAHVNREDIGDIDILDKFTFVDATENAAKSILKNCAGKKIGRRKVKVEVSNKKK